MNSKGMTGFIGAATYEFQSIPDIPQDEDEYNSDDDVNNNRVGLPAIDRYFVKFKNIERSVEMGKD